MRTPAQAAYIHKPGKYSPVTLSGLWRRATGQNPYRPGTCNYNKNEASCPDQDKGRGRYVIKYQTEIKKIVQSDINEHVNKAVKKGEETKGFPEWA